MAAKGPESTPEHRRTVVLTDVPPQSPPAVPRPRQAQPPRRRTAGDMVMVAAERLLGRLAPTLHLALLMAAVSVAGVIVVAITAGILPALLCGLIVLAIVIWPR